MTSQDIETLKSSLTEDQQSIFDALSCSLSDWKHNERIRLQIMRFPNGFKGREDDRAIGRAVDCSLSEEIDYRRSFVNKLLPTHSSGELTKRKLLQPLEVGVVVEMFKIGDQDFGGRRKTDVTAVSWVFLDSDSGHDARQLRSCLNALEVAFIFAESSSSRLSGTGLPKWHLFLPLATPKKLADRKAPGVADVETANAAAAWWDRVHKHVATQLFALAGIDYSADGDMSSDRIVQGHFVPHRPDASPERALIYPESGGCCLDLDKFLIATGFEDLSPPVIMLQDIEKSVARTPRNLDGIVDDEDDGETPGETSGSLLLKALEPLHLVGKYVANKDAYEALCPWRHSHKSAVAAGTENNYSDSTMVFMGGKDGERDGGFSCFHGGCAATAGNGYRVDTSVILKWAREQGVPLPDRRGYGGCSTMLETPPPAEPRKLPPTPPVAFATAPAVEEEPPRPPPVAQTTIDRSKRLVIEIDNDRLQEMIDGGIAALAGVPEVVNSRGDVVTAGRQGHPGFFKVSVGKGFALAELVETTGRAPFIRPSTKTTLPPKIQLVSKWVRPQQPDRMPLHDDQRAGIDPPGKTIASIITAGVYPNMREIRGIITTPAIHPDGVVLQQPGYNESLGVLYHPICRVPLVSPDPSFQTLLAAKEQLLNVISDYPFKKGYEDLCRGVWLAAIFTRLLRTVYRGNIPMFVVSSGDRGSGKGILIDVAAIISDGVTSESTAFAADEAENERIIGKILKGEAPIVHLDNIRSTLSSTSYEQYLTTASFSTREIGSSNSIKKQREGEVGGLADTMFWASGTSLVTGGDMSRRVLRVDIDDTSGSPQDRKVKCKDLVQWAKDNRPKLLQAALTLCTGYFAARRRGYLANLPPFASFVPWSIVREVVVWMGLPDPMLARGQAASDDTDTNFGFLVENLLEFGLGDQEMPQFNVVKAIVDDNKGKAPKHAGFYNFLAETAQLNMKDCDKANGQLGAWLATHKYVGRTHRTPDGRRWTLTKRRTKKCFVISAQEQKD